MQCILEGSKTLELKNKEKVTLGRNKFTRVKEARVSRSQVEVTANYSTKTVLIKQTGLNESAVNGKPIGIGLEVTAKDGDAFDLLVGVEGLSYKILFKDPNANQHPVDFRNGGSKADKAPPAKLAKMFLPKGEPSADDFRKDPPPGNNRWEHVKGNDLLIYHTNDSVRKSSTNVREGEIMNTILPRLPREPRSRLFANHKESVLLFQVAAFDLDGTIITTKSGRVFPRDDLDWRFVSNSVISTLQNFLSTNPSFKFVIFTNQAGLEKHGAQIPSFKKKIETITKTLGIPSLVFIGTGKNEFRKPMTGSWDVFVRKFNDGVEPDRLKSFYCGDAAGRKKDHSIGDRLFALNLRLLFQTPEEFFQGQKPQDFAMPEFLPGRLIELMEAATASNQIDFPHSQEMVIMVGYPGSGKSTFVKTTLVSKSYISVNRDTMKSMGKCVSTADKALLDGNSVVVDNTNGTKKAREEFIKIAKKHNCILRCFKMNVNYTHALHNNRFRQLTSDPHASVPMVAFNTFRSQFQEPTLDEGFVEIVTVPFVPHFANEEHKHLYSMFLIEK